MRQDRPMESFISLGQFIRAFGADPLILPSGYLVGSSRSDWKPALGAIQASSWKVEVKTQDGSIRPLSVLGRDLLEGETVYIRTDVGLNVNFFYWGDEDSHELEFDIDLREFHRQEVLDDLCDLIVVVGTASQCDVVIKDESGNGPPILVWKYATGDFALYPIDENTD
jgi:hypothetical protein